MFDHGFLPTPGWGLNMVWLAHDGLPNKGILTLEFYAGNGANMLGCLVDRRLRSILCAVVLVSQRDVMLEFKINKQENFAVAEEKAEAVAKAAAAAVLAASTSARVRTSSGGSGGAGGAVGILGGGRSSKSPTLTRGSSKRFVAIAEETAMTTMEATDDSSAEGLTSEDALGTHSLEAFTRPHAVASLAALATHAPKMSNLYYEEKQKKNVMTYTSRDANAHLKTVNIEWVYTDGDNSKLDPWRM